MKTTLNANEMSLPEGIQPIAIARSGFLKALLMESEEGCQFVICREDPDTGEVGTIFRPADLESMATLTATIANAFHTILDGPMGDDLGCLAHCMSSSLGFGFDEGGAPKRAGKTQ